MQHLKRSYIQAIVRTSNLGQLSKDGGSKIWKTELKLLICWKLHFLKKCWSYKDSNNKPAGAVSSEFDNTRWSKNRWGCFVKLILGKAIGEIPCLSIQPPSQAFSQVVPLVSQSGHPRAEAKHHCVTMHCIPRIWRGLSGSASGKWSWASSSPKGTIEKSKLLIHQWIQPTREF